MVYHVPKEHVSTQRRLARAALIVAITLVGTYAIRIFLHLRSQKFDIWDIIPCVVAALFDSARNTFEIEVDNNSIRMRSGFVFAERRIVHRGRIRYFLEFHGNLLREPALHLSEHHAFKRFFLSGTVMIPATLLQYEEIKQLAMTWKEIA
jgi:hypothetical protein